MDYLLDKLIDIIFWFAEGVVNLLPTYQVSNSGMIQSLANWLATFNQYLPMVEMIECLVFYLAFCAIYLGVKPIVKLARIS